MAGERGNEEAKKKKEWNDGDATLHSMPASRILPQYLLLTCLSCFSTCLDRKST